MPRTYQSAAMRISGRAMTSTSASIAAERSAPYAAPRRRAPEPERERPRAHPSPSFAGRGWYPRTGRGKPCRRLDPARRPGRSWSGRSARRREPHGGPRRSPTARATSPRVCASASASTWSRSAWRSPTRRSARSTSPTTSSTGAWPPRRDVPTSTQPTRGRDARGVHRRASRRAETSSASSCRPR